MKRLWAVAGIALLGAAGAGGLGAAYLPLPREEETDTTDALAQESGFVVNTTADLVDGNIGDGVCATVEGTCSLRAAVQEANAVAGPQSIDVPAGMYALSIPGVTEEASAAGDLDVTDDVTIVGADIVATILDGAGLDRVIEAHEPASLSLARLTIQNGNTQDQENNRGGGIAALGALTLNEVKLTGNMAASGGGVYVSGTATVSKSAIADNHGGSGIYNAGTLTMADSHVLNNSGIFGGGIANNGSLNLRSTILSGNHAAGGGGGIYSTFGHVSIESSTIQGNVGVTAWGGILVKDGSLAMAMSLVDGNSAGGNGGVVLQSSTFEIATTTIRANRATDPAFGHGGGLVIGNSEGTVSSSLIEANVASQSAGGVYLASGTTPARATFYNTTISGNLAGVSGGGVVNAFDAKLDLVNVTLSGNTALAGGGIHNTASLAIVNTIIANSTGPNCFGAITSLGHNLDSDGSCALNGPGDIPNADPLLGPLTDNGGSSHTHALFANSPAIDSGDPTRCTADDQRGVARPMGARCDIGAYESNMTREAQPPATPVATPRHLPEAGGSHEEARPN
jgi:CSLREA domain-containing protein